MSGVNLLHPPDTFVVDSGLRLFVDVAKQRDGKGQPGVFAVTPSRPRSHSWTMPAHCFATFQGRVEP